MNRNSAVGAGSLLATAFIFGFFGILTRLVGFKLPLFYASSIRNLLLAAILFIAIIAFRQWRKLEKKDLPWMFVRSLGGFVSFIGSYIPMFYMEIGTVYFIFYAGSTIMGYILGKFIFKENLGIIKWLSLGLSLVGLVLIYSVNLSAGKWLYLLMSLIGGFGVAFWNTFSKKVSDKYSATQLNLIDTVNFIVIEVIISLVLREKWVTPEFSWLWFYMFLFVLMFLSTGQLVVIGFKHVEASVGSLIMLSEVIFGILLSYLFFKETVSLAAFIGGILVMLAIILPETKFRKRIFGR